MKLSARRSGLYSKLPPELADLLRCVREAAEQREAGQLEQTAVELESMFLIVERVRRWEDRQLRLQDGAIEQLARPRRRQRKASPHLRLV